MTNAKATAHGVGPRAQGDIADIFLAREREAKTKVFSRVQLRDFLVENGRSPLSVQNVLETLRERGAITRGRARGTYTITTGGTK